MMKANGGQAKEGWTDRKINEVSDLVSKRTGKKTHSSVASEYAELCSYFPLRPIRTEAENEAAMAVADSLLARVKSLSLAEKDYLDMLAEIIHKYEADAFASDDVNISANDLIRSLIDAQGIKQVNLAKELEISPARLSDFLNGRRKLSIKMARKLCQRFSLSLEQLFDVDNESRAKSRQAAGKVRLKYGFGQQRQHCVSESSLYFQHNRTNESGSFGQELRKRLAKIEDRLASGEAQLASLQNTLNEIKALLKRKAR